MTSLLAYLQTAHIPYRVLTHALARHIYHAYNAHCLAHGELTAYAVYHVHTVLYCYHG